MSESSLYVTCPKCGRRNPLGRVFCIGCGNRLPADALAVDEVRRKAVAARLRSGLRRWVSFAITLGVLAVLGLALWPQSEPAISVDEQHVERFRRDMRVFHQALQRGHTGVRLVQTFAQDDLNAYLKSVQAQDQSELTTSIQLAPEGLRVRGVRPWFTLDVGAFTWRPRMSTDVVYRLHADGLRFDRAWFGHLRLPRTLGTPVNDHFVRLLHARSEWVVLRHLRCVALDEASITLALEPDA